MRRFSVLIILLSCCLLVPMTAATRELTKVGSGTVRYLGMIQVYDASLWALPGSTRKQVQQAATSFCLELDYHVALKPDQFIQAAETILHKQHDPTTLERYRAQLNQLHASYQPVREGDQYRLCFNAMQKNTQLLLNDRELVAISGTEFASLYAGIWLADEAPLDQRLQRNLLGSLSGNDL